MVIMFPYASTIEPSVQAADLATKDIIITSSGVISPQGNFEVPYSGSIYSKDRLFFLEISF